MRTLLTRKAGAPGTKRLQAKHGEDLVCVRYRYDAENEERIKTVELVLERVPWRPRTRVSGDELVRLRLRDDEHLLRRELLLNGGQWDERTGTWRVRRSVAAALGLTRRALRDGPRKRSTDSTGRRDLRVSRKHYR